MSKTVPFQTSSFDEISNHVNFKPTFKQTFDKLIGVWHKTACVGYPARNEPTKIIIGAT